MFILLMSLILKLFEEYFLTQEQTMDTIRIWYIIKHRANPSTIKMLFLTSIPKLQRFFKIFFDDFLFASIQ